MKILGLSTSPRKGQTTYQALNACLEAAASFDDRIETELIDFADSHIHPCHSCGACRNKVTCSIEDDFTKHLPKLADDDVAGIIIATPVYMGSMSGVCKCILDRTVSLRRNGFLWRNKVGGVLALGHSRNGGQELAITHVQAAMMIHDMLIVSDGQPTSHFGGTMWTKDGVDADEIGLATATGLGKRVAEVALRTYHA